MGGEKCSARKMLTKQAKTHLLQKIAVQQAEMLKPQAKGHLQIKKATDVPQESLAKIRL